MASVILLRAVPIEHVTLAGEGFSSRRAVLRCLPETVRADVREQTRDARLSIDVIPFARLIRALEVMP